VPREPHRVFPPYRLDPANAQLWRDEEEISLRPKTFDVLRYLVDHPGLLVTKGRILDEVWPGVAVSDTMPATCIAELRRILGDDAKNPRFIETVHRRGYRFIAPVITATAPQARREASSESNGSKPIIVARDEELVQLRRWYSQVLEGRRQVVFVAGEAGIGKTTFVHAFIDSIAHGGTARIGRGQCVEQYGAGEPYMPIFEALSRLSREPLGDTLVDILHKFAPTWLAQMPELLTSEERSRLQAETQGVTQQRMLREMMQALEALAAELPLVLVIDDLHWSDFSTLGLFSAIARRSERARLLLVGTYRPVEILAKDHPLRTMKQELLLHHYCQELRLRLLSKEDTADYLAQRLSHELSQRFAMLAPIVHARTDGNPLFMVNMVDYLLDGAGLLVKSREVSEVEWAETLRTQRLDALKSIRQMIERNLERLNPEEQEVLQGASVAGAEFSAASVAAALERPQDEVEECCARLARTEQFVSEQDPIAWPDGTVAAGFRFRHSLYQEVLYDRLPAGVQLQLHRRIAARQEAGYGEHVDEVASQLAHHYSRANDRNKAIQYFRLAGERALARGAPVEAEDHYRRTLILVGELPQTAERDRLELTLCMALGVVLRGSRSWSHPDRRLAYIRAQELAEKLGETSQLVEVLLGLGVATIGSGQMEAGCEIGERMVAAAERSGSGTELCAAHAFLGQCLMWRAQFVEAQRHLELGSSCYDEGDPRWFASWGVDALAVAAIVALLRGFPEQARRLFDQALDRSKSRNDRFRLVIVHMWGAVFCELLHDASATLEQTQVLHRVAPKEPVWSAYADLFTAMALMMQSKWSEGEGYLRKAIRLYQTAGLESLQTWAKLCESELLAAQGQVDDALLVADDAIGHTDELLHFKSRALGLRANLLARNGADASTVESAYRAAVECARLQGARYFELQATTGFAGWLNSQHRPAEARTLLSEIYNWFTEGFDTFALREARELLDQLGRE
jgi:DNA-binding winged helix-turn-helix (wHTH) protein/tetratricopeptide (TPR) repeat protein